MQFVPRVLPAAIPLHDLTPELIREHMNVLQLKIQLGRQYKDTRGSKSELIARLLTALGFQ